MKSMRLVILLVAAALVALLAIQLFWANRLYRINEEQFTLKVNGLLSKTVKQVNDELGCFELFSKAYINPREGFYMMKQSWKDSTEEWLAASDTVTMFFAGAGKQADSPFPYNWNDLKFSMPVKAEILLRFTYEMSDTTSFNFESRQLHERINAENFRDLVSGSRPVYIVYDTLVIDSILKKNLSEGSVNAGYHFGIVRSDLDSVVFRPAEADAEQLLSSVHSVPLSDSKYFSKPYNLAVYFDNKPGLLFASMSGMLITSMIVVVALLILFGWFVRSVLRQKKLTDMKTDFINNMTHEFNTPIANISLAVETLNDGKFSRLTPQAEKILNIVSIENERLRNNVQRILQIAALDKHEYPCTYEPVDIDSVIKKVITGFELKAIEKNAQISYQSTAGNVVIDGDETHLVNILYNLLDNSFKYSNGNCRMSIQLMNENGGIKLAVEDNGTGMSEEMQKHIFEKFYRGQNGNVHNVKGFGLGLSYVKTMVEMHRGSISVSSQPGKGSRFEIILPFHQQQHD